MNTDATAQPRRCPACDAVLPADAPMGLCVPCLFATCVSAEPGRFGDFELLGPAREGGMGVVYRARQISLNRIVALKMIRGSYLATLAQVKRFRAEAEAAAALDHPHIVPIHEVGEYEGRLYFAMKWMDGGSLAEAIKNWKLSIEHLPLPRKHEPALGNAQFQILNSQYSQFSIATLVATIARAVHHAHQRGLIHRDLKPSNILLDAQGQPHVTDFGLAKRVGRSDKSRVEETKPAPDAESSSPWVGEGRGEGGRSSNSQPSTLNPQLTLSGDTLGTPAYMAPEQAAGKARDVTIAADVYSLGAMLYELLAGRPPFVGETPLDTLRKVVEEEPVPPSKCEVRSPRDEHGRSFAFRPSSLSLDLETICLKCLEKEPERRYASADALADDLERWLRGEPILARPSSLWDRAHKWIRRRPAVAGLLALLIVTALAGFVAVLWQLRQTERARQEAERARQVAVQNLDTALEAVTKYLIGLANDAQLQRPELANLNRDLLQSAVTFLDEFSEQQSDNPSFGLRRAAAYRSLAEAQSKIGHNGLAITNALKARALCRALGTAHARSSAVSIEWGENCRLAAKLYRFVGRLRQAEQFHLEAIEVSQRLAGELPALPRHRRQLAGNYGAYASTLFEMGRPQAAQTNYHRAVEMLRELIARGPAEEENKRELVRIVRNAEDYFLRFAEAGANGTNALSLALALAHELANYETARPADQATLASLWGQWGEEQRRQSRHTEAEHSLRQSLAWWERLLRFHPGQPQYENGQAAAQTYLGSLLAVTGHWPEAERAFQMATGIFQDRLRYFPDETEPKDYLGRVHAYAARSHLRAGHHRQALDHLEQARMQLEPLCQMETHMATYHADLADTLRDLGKLLQTQDRHAEAQNAFREARTHYEMLAAEYPEERFWQSKAEEVRALVAHQRP